MRRIRMTKAAKKIVSSVLTVSVLLSSFVFLASAARNTGTEQDRDFGDPPIGASDSALGESGLGASSRYQIGYSSPVGYSIHVTYDDGDSIVKDGDSVPADTTIQVEVEVDTEEGYSSAFQLFVNDEEKTNQLDEVTLGQSGEPSLAFRTKHVVNSDSVIRLGWESLVMPSAFSLLGNVITVEADSHMNTGWQYVNTTGVSGAYVFHYRCDYCGSGNACGQTATTTSSSTTPTPVAPGGSTLSKKIQCDVAQWWNVPPLGTKTLTVEFNSPVSGQNATGILITALNAKKATTLTFSGRNGAGQQPEASININNAMAAASTTVVFNNVDVTSAGITLDATTPKVQLDNIVAPRNSNITGPITVNTNGELRGSNTTLTGSPTLTVSGGTVSHSGLSGLGIINITSGTVSGIVTGNGTVTMSGGTISGKVTTTGGQIIMNGSAPGGTVSGTLMGGTASTVGTGTVTGTVGVTSGDLTIQSPLILGTGATLSAKNGTVIRNAPFNNNLNIPTGRVEAAYYNIPAGVTQNIGTLSLRATSAGQISTLESGTIGTLFAGGPVTVNSGAKINIAAYAGAENASTAVPSVLLLNGVTNSSGSAIPNVYCGGGKGTSAQAAIDVNANTKITNIHGGTSYDGTTVTSGTINLNGGTVANAFGGGSDTDDSTVSLAIINVNAGEVTGDVYGGNRTGASTVSNITINVGGTVSGEVDGTVYGGNAAGNGTVTNATINVGGTTAGKVAALYGGNAAGNGKVSNVNIIVGGTNAGEIGSSVFGGGKTGTVTASKITVNAKSKIGGALYGGGVSDTTGTTHIVINTPLINGTEINGDIYGGGSAGNVTGSTTVEVNQAVSGCTIYGGSSGTGTITGTGTNVLIKANVTGNVYGGSVTANTNATNIKIDASKTVTGDVFGGNQTGGTVGGSVIVNDGTVTKDIHGGTQSGGTFSKGVSITNSGTVSGDIFGAGQSGAFTLNGGSITINNTGTLPGSIHGGGENNTSATINGNIFITNTGSVGKDIFGGAKNAGAGNTNTFESNHITIVNDGVIGTGGIYGGSENSKFDKISGKISITNEVGKTVPQGIYGGGKQIGRLDVTAGINIDNKGTITAFGIHGGSKKVSGSGLTANDQASKIAGGIVIVNTGTVSAPGIYGTDEDGYKTGTNAGNYSSVSGGVSITNMGNGNVIGGIFGGFEKSGRYTISNSGSSAVRIINQGSAVVGPTGIYGGSSAPQIDTDLQSNIVGVYITNSATVNGPIYGGGYSGTNTITDASSILGSYGAIVEITGGTVTGDIHGGHNVLAGERVSSTYVTVTGGSVKNVFGGGHMDRTANPVVENNVFHTATVSVTGGTVAPGCTVYGGGEGGSATGRTVVTVGVDITSGKNVYGGGKDSKIGEVPTSAADGSTSVTITTGAKIDNVFGGGTGTDATVVGNTSVLVNHANAVIRKNVYGGGEVNDVNTASNVSWAKVEIRSGLVQGNVYGGGLDSSATSTSVTVSAPVEGNVYGGGVSSSASAPAPIKGHASSNPTVNVEIKTNSTIGIGSPVSSGGNVFGGGTGNDAPVTGNTIVTISGGTVGHDTRFGTGTVYGGGDNNPVTGTTVVRMSGGEIHNDVFGGGLDAAGTVQTGPNTALASQVIIGHNTGSGHVYGNVYGGGSKARVNGATKVEILSSGQVDGDVFGAGLRAAIDGNADVLIDTSATVGADTNSAVHGGGTGVGATVGGSTTVMHKDGDVLGAIFGGGRGPGCSVAGNATVTVDGPDATVGSNVYGGGYGSGSDVQGNIGTIVNILQGNVANSVYGGGRDSKVIGNAVVLIKTNVGTAGAGDVVYGGGTGASGSTIGGNTSVTINGTANPLVNANVYGGGDGAGNHVTGSATVLIETGKVDGDVYGGGHDSDVAKTSVTNNTDVTGSIWGGGVAKLALAAVTNGGTVVTVDGGTVGGHVHGGGYSTAGLDAPVAGDVAATIKDAQVDGSVFGGGQADDTGFAPVSGDVTLKVDSSEILTDLWGGGHGTVSGTTDAHAIVGGSVAMTIANSTIGTAGSGDGYVHGGGDGSAVEGTVTLNTSGDTTVYQQLYGGGRGDKATVNTANPIDFSNVIEVTLDGNTKVMGDVYGGGDGGDVFGSIKLDVVSKEFGGNIYGGSKNASVEHNTDVWVHSGANVEGSVFGGGIKDSLTPPSNTHTVGGKTEVTIDGHIHEYVWGGGHWVDVLGVNGTSVTINGTVDKDVSGGGLDANITNSNPAADVGGASVYIKQGAKVGQDVYGGGYNTSGDGTVGNLTGMRGAYVELSGNGQVIGSVYGGGRNHGDITNLSLGGTRVRLLDKSQVGVDVYGGGNVGDVMGLKGTIVELLNESRVAGTVYGGSYEGDVVGERGTTVELRDTTLVGGDVYGGGYGFAGNNKGHVLGEDGTRVTLYPQAQVRGTIYGGSYYADISHPQGGTDVKIYGLVGYDYQVPGNVYGGGNHGDVLGDRGTKMLVQGTNAIVSNNVYGGGYEGAVSYNTVVDVNSGAEVWHSIFGGGHQPESPAGANGPAHVSGTTTVTVKDLETKVGRKDLTRLPDNHTLIDIVENDDLEQHTGRIFGGGDGASVGSPTSVVVEGLRQIAYRSISGGNFGVLSANSPRTVTLSNLGTGEGTNNAYDNLYNYAVIKHLQDYTESNITDSYLTVYYHLKSAENETDNGIPYPTNYQSIFNTSGGKYHPWRPYPHKDIVVEPRLNVLGGTMFRMEGGYTIDMRSGGITRAEELLIDHRAGNSVTSKIYGPSNNIVEQGVFSYNYLPKTIFVSNLFDRLTFAVCGINLYIPPMNIGFVAGNSTNNGGSTVIDYTTGNEGHGGTPVEYTTQTTRVVAEPDLIQKVRTAAEKQTKGAVAYVNEARYDQITAETLSAARKAAVAEKGNVTVMFDTMKGQAVQGRLYLDLAKSFPSKNTQLGVYTTPDRIAKAKSHFERHFQGNFAFVNLAQTESFGGAVQIAAKVDLSKLETKNLHFYAYSESTNTYQRIATPQNYMDKNGYLHFYTAVGGTIVITDAPLVRK